MSNPQAWKLVPVVPTEEMIQSGVDQNPTNWVEGTDRGFPRDVANDVYVSMLRAAPTPPPSTSGLTEEDMTTLKALAHDLKYSGREADAMMLSAIIARLAPVTPPAGEE